MKTNFGYGYAASSWKIKSNKNQEVKSQQNDMPAEEKALSKRLAACEEKMRTTLDDYFGALASQNKALIGQTNTSSTTVKNEDGSHTTTLTCTHKSTGEVTSVTTREYDASGRLPKETIVCYENGTVKSTTINTETYNEDGSTTGSTVKLDASGRIIEEDSVTIDKDGNRTYSPRIKYVYNEDGSYTKTQIDYDEAGTPINNNVYNVDKDGNATLVSGDGTNETPATTATPKTASLNILSKVSENCTITENEDGTTTATIYDEKGRAVR